MEQRPLQEGDGTAETSTRSAVVSMLTESAASWNAGDLDGFVDDYSDDPTLAFVGSSGVTRGIAEVRARYESGYWSTGAPLDSLRFEDIEVRPLGTEHALALGRYVLYRPVAEGDAATSDSLGDPTPAESAGPRETITSTGWFSLILGLEDGQWRILHDHTSELDGG